MEEFIVNVTVTLRVKGRNEDEIEHMLENMDYDFTASDINDSEILDTNITDWEIEDIDD